MTSVQPSMPIPPDPAAVLVGRLEVPGVGPHLVTLRGDVLVDVTRSMGPTMSDLLDLDHPADDVREAVGEGSWSLHDVLRASLSRDSSQPHLLAPFDLAAIKAAGVTFAKSMVERVIEEHAKGDPGAARALRERLGATVADAARVTPGSPESAEIKQRLLAEGLWSQYLEVGIGPDPEIFTKGQPLSSVGIGSCVGVLERSTWNNPEPEVVLACSASGRAVGATLGNDVNLRDFEGRSALLLAEAKDNNASCALGPFIRLFTEDFGLEELRQSEVSMRITGRDGFVVEAVSRVNEMSRTFEELISHTWGPHHQYPDGFALFTGTMFAPTEDRDGDGEGFTHHVGDEVLISNPLIGALVNEVRPAESLAPWTFGARSLMANLADRGLLK
ncbi:fumarylacetoacetate hydrolase [Pseudoclavibacter sp. RFBB5]|nr:fumarylacetoacetate hydrolase [Pseudoclavibacter sp. RFBB5]